jgi:hypothetical protein
VSFNNATVTKPNDATERSIALLIKNLAPGWTARTVMSRLCEIQRFVLMASLIPLPRRRKIGRLARDLLVELNRLGGLSPETMADLHALAAGVPARSVTDRRVGQFRLKDSVRRMAVRLYIEACADPGFSKDGPIHRFVNAVGELVLNERAAFSSDSVKAEFNGMKRAVRKHPSLPYPLPQDKQRIVRNRILTLLKARAEQRGE